MQAASRGYYLFSGSEMQMKRIRDEYLATSSSGLLAGEGFDGRLGGDRDESGSLDSAMRGLKQAQPSATYGRVLQDAKDNHDVYASLRYGGCHACFAAHLLSTIAIT